MLLTRNISNLKIQTAILRSHSDMTASIEINILTMILKLITTTAYFFLAGVRSGRRRREAEE
jgi:hypothetical protein